MSGDAVTLSYVFRRFLLCFVFCGWGWGIFENPSKAVTSLTVMWNQSSDTNVQGYKVYYGTVSQQYTNVVVAGNATNATITGVKPGVTYYFAATSYNAAGWQSAYSPEISYTVPLLNAQLTSVTNAASGFNFSVNGTAAMPYVVMASTNLVNWVALATNTAPFVFTDTNTSRFSRRFYQAVLESVYIAQFYVPPPVVSPPLVSPLNASGGFTFTVNNTVGSAYVILASTNLVNWVALATNTAPFTFTDTNSSQFSRRFYKAVLESAYVPQISTTPLTSPPLGSPASTLAGFTFTVNQTAGSAYVIVASTNLVNWVALATNTAPFTFTDTNSSQFSRRFYKAILESAYVPQISTTPGATPSLSASAYGTAGFSFTLTGTTGSAYVVEASTNLVTWVPLVTNTAPFNFVDPNASKFSRRFYKAIPLP